jgi:hypothetical protein
MGFWSCSERQTPLYPQWKRMLLQLQKIAVAVVLIVIVEEVGVISLLGGTAQPPIVPTTTP